MSIQHVPPAPALPGREPQAMLFTPGARLGWIFRDRRTLPAPYPEPEPDLEKLREQAAARTAAAQARYARARRWAGKPSLIAAVVPLLLAGCAKAVNSGEGGQQRRRYRPDLAHGADLVRSGTGLDGGVPVPAGPGRRGQA